MRTEKRTAYSPKEKHSYCLRWFNANYPGVNLVYTKSVSGK